MPSFPKIPLMLALLPFTLAGCSVDGAGGASHVVRDSAGVSIIESRTPEWPDGSGWQVDAEPSVSIGQMDGEDVENFHMIRAARRLGDGTIVVANGGTAELRAFDSSGRHLWTSGRSGAGPGEFQLLYRLVRIPGDSLLATDAGLRRVSVFDGSGAFVRSWQPAGSSFHMPVASLADGTLIGTGSSMPPDVDGLTRTPDLLVRFEGEDHRPEEGSELTTSLYYFRHVTTGGGPGVRNELLPFQPLGRVAAHAEGVYAGNGEAYEIRDFDADGSLRRILRVLQPARPVTSELISLEIDALVARMPEGRREAVRSDMEALPRLGEVPAFNELVADSEGFLWVRHRGVPSGNDREWHVFHPDGQLLGSVRLPAGVQVEEIGRDYVLGVVRDEWDVERVSLHRLSRDGEG